MYEELVENLKSLREDYFQTQDDDNFCFGEADADMVEEAAEVIEDLELVSRSQQAACNQFAEVIEKLQSELEQVKAEKEAAIKELKGCCIFCRYYKPGIRGISSKCAKCLVVNGDRPNWQWRGL